MTLRTTVTLEGNEACASVAYRLNEVIAIYPITPSSTMGELADEWTVQNRANVWGRVPRVVEMQSEGGAAGAVHGALLGGALATTFTASQGLLLMIPNMYKIAGELTPFVMHVAARCIATHALSIFGDHSDVTACRQTGFAMLASQTVQEAHDMACAAQAATLESRVPFLHFFDGFRTSHEIARIEPLSDDDLRAMINADAIRAHHHRGLSPERPTIRGTAQNPDVYFQAREACNPFYDACPAVVENVFDRFAARTGRRYRLFEYYGAPDAERVIVVMASAVETARETADYLNARGERLGVVGVRLLRPFSARHFLAALPPTTRAIAVLDRTKEPGAGGEPLYLDVLSALQEARRGAARLRAEPRVIGGRFGLSGKEFTPAMASAVFEELARPEPRHGFTVGIVDDVTHRSLPFDPLFDIEPPDVLKAVFYGLGADGTVGANKNSIKIIGEETDRFAQGYFVYDSKKSGSTTVSHLRFGPRPIRAPYLIRRADFVAIHQFEFLDRLDVLDIAAEEATILLNAPYPPEQVWDQLPREVQEQLLSRQLRLFVIDAAAVAERTGMGRRINTVMQTCFFAISGVLPRELALGKIKESIRKSYSKKGEELVRRNWAAVDETLTHLHEVKLPRQVSAMRSRPRVVPPEAPDFVQRVTATMLAGHGDLLPVSAFPPDGAWPTATSQWEKRSIASEIPIWDPDLCIQCDKCAQVCPHAAIRAKVYDPALLDGAPTGFRTAEYKARDFKGRRFTLQVAPEDCTGCQLCVQICPAKDKANPRHKAINMQPQRPLRQSEREFYRYFLGLPEIDPRELQRMDVKSVQLLQPLMEYSGACSGCGETPYIKLLTQLFGDRLVIANATGCSSIYGGNLPTTPYTVNRDGRGPAWANSLFEDNAEFGLGIRMAMDVRHGTAQQLVQELAPEIGVELAQSLLHSRQETLADIAEQRERVALLRTRLGGILKPEARALERRAEDLVEKSVWIVGGDGWAYDIGFGGLDHVLASGRNVKVLVLDTEVYSNTGGQASKATPLGAAAKFASNGKSTPKKDLGLTAMTYGNVYVASVAMGAKDQHTVDAFLEAQSYPGPALIIAYSHCIAHGYDLMHGNDQQKRAVDCGLWPLYRYDPRRTAEGLPPLILDAPAGKIPVSEYMRNETRFRMVEKIDESKFKRLAAASQEFARRRVAYYQHLSNLILPKRDGSGSGSGASENATPPADTIQELRPRPTDAPTTGDAPASKGSGADATSAHVGVDGRTSLSSTKPSGDRL